MTKTMKIHDSAIERFERNLLDEQDRLTQDFLQTLQVRMTELNMSQSDMAYTLGKSRAYVSKLFNKGQNLTIRTMVELSHSLDLKLAISARRLWMDIQHAPRAVPMNNGWTQTDRLTCAPTPVICTGKLPLKGSNWRAAANDNFENLLQSIS